MFIQGKVADADQLRHQSEVWLREIKPKAKEKGFLGFTGGVTPDGRLMWLAGFESEESARAASDLPEQGGLVGRDGSDVGRRGHVPRLS